MIKIYVKYQVTKSIMMKQLEDSLDNLDQILKMLRELRKKNNSNWKMISISE